MTDKNTIRQQQKVLRKNLPIEVVQELSKQILGNLTKIVDAYDTFFVYNSFGKEIDTHQLMNHLLKNGKTVYLPRVIGQDMVAVRTSQNTQFAISKFGIEEPIGKAENIDNFVAIMPCLAVDVNGNRVGYGGGYYDRFLQGKSALKIVLCAEHQIVGEFEHLSTDIPVDKIVTEKRVLTCNNLKNVEYCR